jgi:ribonucleoside-diphosphate reductase alpha chain
LSKIDRVPQDLRDIYATAFEVEPKWLVEAASRRQKWIDQAQSLNIYMAGASGKKLDETYKLAWLRGLKTTYYLRTIAATHMEKSTTRTGALNAVPVSGGLVAGHAAPAANGPVAAAPAAPAAAAASAEVVEGAACYLRPGDAGFDECEACQ